NHGRAIRSFVRPDRLFLRVNRQFCAESAGKRSFTELQNCQMSSSTSCLRPNVAASPLRLSRPQCGDLRIQPNAGLGVVRPGQPICDAEGITAAVKLMMRQSSRLDQNADKAD